MERATAYASCIRVFRLRTLLIARDSLCDVCVVVEFQRFFEVFVCACVCIHVCFSRCVCMCVYTCMYVCTYILYQICAFQEMCMQCMHACMNACMYVCMYVRNTKETSVHCHHVFTCQVYLCRLSGDVSACTCVSFHQYMCIYHMHTYICVCML